MGARDAQSSTGADARAHATTEARPPKARSRRGIAFLVLLAAILLALLALRDCMPGLGPSGGATDGVVGAEGDDGEGPGAPDRPSSPTGLEGDGPIRIVVRADRCGAPSDPASGPGTYRDCDEACEIAGATGRPVILEATAGSQGEVETLQACLKEKGSDVSIEAD